MTAELSAKTFLLLGDGRDTLSQRVAEALSHHGHQVIVTRDPLAAPFVLSWHVHSDRHADVWAWARADGHAPALDGVLVRSSGGPTESEGWDPTDLAYVRAEAHAALLAWLWGLRCPVINQYSADLWVRPQRSYPEWQRLFTECALPAADILVTNEIDRARAFAARSGQHVTYMPLTSWSRYAITTSEHWMELAKLLDHVPVCLVAGPPQPSTYGTVVGRRIVWDHQVHADVRALEPGLLRLADRLGVDLIQVEIALTQAGVRCILGDVYARLERHDDTGQQAVVDAIVELLEHDRRAARPPLPPEALFLAGCSR